MKLGPVVAIYLFWVSGQLAIKHCWKKSDKKMKMVAKEITALIPNQKQTLKWLLKVKVEATSDIVLLTRRKCHPKSGLDARCRNGISF